MKSSMYHEKAKRENIRGDAVTGMGWGGKSYKESSDIYQIYIIERPILFLNVFK